MDQVVPVTSRVRKTSLFVRIEVKSVVTGEVAGFTLNALVKSVTTLAVRIRKTGRLPQAGVYSKQGGIILLNILRLS